MEQNVHLLVILTNEQKMYFKVSQEISEYLKERKKLRFLIDEQALVVKTIKTIEDIYPNIVFQSNDQLLMFLLKDDIFTDTQDEIDKIMNLVRKYGTNKTLESFETCIRMNDFMKSLKENNPDINFNQVSAVDGATLNFSTQ